MSTKLVSGVLLGAMLAAGADIRGNIVIDRKLTRHNVTAAAGIYERGTPVELKADTDQDPIAFERAHVAVYIEGPSGSTSPKTLSEAGGVKAAIEQKDRRFVPDLVVIPAGATVSFPNFDPIFHNVFSLSNAKSFDLGNYPQGQTRLVSFPTPGAVAVYCHLHPNMAATILVTPNSWAARVDPSGAFTLNDVPPGSYTVVAWHKAVGTVRKTINVGEGANTEITFTLPYVDSRETKHVAQR